MGKALNVRFIEEYILSEEALSRHPANKVGGIGGYIEALEAQKLDTGGTQALIFLKKCRDIRNRLAHSPGAIRSLDKVTQGDISRLKRIRRDVARGRDPLTRRRTPKRGSATVTALLFLIAVLLLAILLKQ